MNAIQLLAAQTALKHMLAGSHFSICTIDQILKVTGGVPNADDYETLRLLHCIHYQDMPPELLRELPAVVKRVLGSEAIVIAFDDPPKVSRMRRLLGI
jgi:hypothetical protein